MLPAFHLASSASLCPPSSAHTSASDPGTSGALAMAPDVLRRVNAALGEPGDEAHVVVDGEVRALVGEDENAAGVVGRLLEDLVVLVREVLSQVDIWQRHPEVVIRRTDLLAGEHIGDGNPQRVRLDERLRALERGAAAAGHETGAGAGGPNAHTTSARAAQLSFPAPSRAPLSAATHCVPVPA